MALTTGKRIRLGLAALAMLIVFLAAQQGILALTAWAAVDDGYSHRKVDPELLEYYPKVGEDKNFSSIPQSESITFQYAQSLGYRDWNDYVARRPSNKNGEKIAVYDPAVLALVESAKTYDPEAAAYGYESVAPVSLPEPQDVDDNAQNRAFRTYYLGSRGRQGGGGGGEDDEDDEDDDTDGGGEEVAVNVPEPGTLPLMAAGILSIAIYRRKFA